MSEYIITTEQLNWFLERMEETVAIPAAIAHLKPIVRCCDCRHFKKGEEEPPVDWCGWFHDEVTPLGFCAWGERRDA